MAHPVPARLTPREGRRFGFTVGAAFLVLAALSLWRGHRVAPWVLAIPGGVLLLAGVLLPGRLSPVYRAWMRLGLALSRVTTPLFMGLLYFVVFTPMAFLLRLFGRNPLRARESGKSFWIRREPRSGDADSMTRQF